MILMSTWLFSSFILIKIFSGEITAMFSLKIPKKQINTLKKIANSKMSLIALNQLRKEYNESKNVVLQSIKEKIDEDNTWSTIDKILNKESIQNVSEGKSAMFFSMSSIKQLLIVHMVYLNPNSTFYFLEEQYRSPYRWSVGSSFNLTKQFRQRLNIR